MLAEITLGRAFSLDSLWVHFMTPPTFISTYCVPGTELGPSLAAVSNGLVPAPWKPKIEGPTGACHMALNQGDAGVKRVTSPSRPWKERLPSPCHLHASGEYGWDSKGVRIPRGVTTSMGWQKVLRAPGHTVIWEPAGPCSTHLNSCSTWNLQRFKCLLENV